MRTLRPKSMLGTLREQALNRKVIDYEATRRALAAQEVRLQYADWVYVDAPGAPPFENGWGNATLDLAWEPYAAEGRNPMAFFRDRWGFIHLKGVVANAAHSVDSIFHVPGDLVPSHREYMASSYKTTSTGYGGALIPFSCLAVCDPDGSVFIGSYYETTLIPARTVILDGMTWRAANVGPPS